VLGYFLFSVSIEKLNGSLYFYIMQIFSKFITKIITENKI